MSDFFSPHFNLWVCPASNFLKDILVIAFETVFKKKIKIYFLLKILNLYFLMFFILKKHILKYHSKNYLKNHFTLPSQIHAKTRY